MKSLSTETLTERLNPGFYAKEEEMVRERYRNGVSAGRGFGF